MIYFALMLLTNALQLLVLSYFKCIFDLQLINELPICHGDEVDVIVTTLLSQLQCRIYTTDNVSSLIATLVDGLKCLAKDPLLYVENKNFDNFTSSAMQDHMISLESILG